MALDITNFVNLVNLLKAPPGSLAKAGARHGKFDRAALQKAHDGLSEMVAGAHCGMPEDIQKEDDVAMAGARHAKADLQRIKDAHDLCKALGAECLGSRPA